MYYALVFYPQIESEPIQAIRRRYDPTADVIEPHVTIMFPVPEGVGETRLLEHLEAALQDCSPFRARLGGFHLSPDHWLFLLLAEGNEAVKGLHRSIYTAVLADYWRHDLEFVPHLGLGLLVRDGVHYDWENPRDSDLDPEKYASAVAEAEALPPGPSFVVDTLHLLEVPDEIVEWKGELERFPQGATVSELHRFQLRDAPV